MYYDYTSHFQKRQLKEQEEVIEEQEQLIKVAAQYIEEQEEQNMELQDQVQTTHVKLEESRDVVVPPIPENPRLMLWCGIIEMAPSFIPWETDPSYVQNSGMWGHNSQDSNLHMCWICPSSTFSNRPCH